MKRNCLYSSRLTFAEVTQIVQGGDLGTAIDICFRSQLFDALRSIAEGLDESADPSLLAK